VFNSSGKPDQARPLFLAAWEKARTAKLDFLAVDAAHMLGILDGLEWHEKAIALAEASSDPKAQGWMGSLLNNLGWTYYDKGDYRKALEVFERDLKWFEERKKDKQAGIAREAIAECQKQLAQKQPRDDRK
jgi:tetratricopeptide (TPR) repeat protein